MAFISQNVPNLIQGVSQQPAALRYNTQAQKQDNAYGTPVDGLMKRPHTEYIDKLSSADASSSQFFHSLDRDENERYILEITEASTPTVKVYDTTDGAEKTVHVPDGTTYLDATAPQTAYKALTISDVTFIVNSEKTVLSDDDSADLGPQLSSVSLSDFTFRYEEDTSTLITPVGVITNEKLVYFRQVVLDTTYRIKITTDSHTIARTQAGGGTSNVTVDGNLTIEYKTLNPDGTNAHADVANPFPSTSLDNGPGSTTEELASAFINAMVDARGTQADGTTGPHVVRTIQANDSADSSESDESTGESGNNDEHFGTGSFQGALLVRQGNVTGRTTESSDDTNQTANAGGVGPCLHFVGMDHINYKIDVDAELLNNTLVVVDSLNGVQAFTDLPPYAPHGFIAKVNGDPESSADDYYVKFEANDGNFGSGYWKETLGVQADATHTHEAAGIPKSFKFETMPHILIRQSDGTFMFKKADGVTPTTGNGRPSADAADVYSGFKWADRTVGDDETNPFPSFVNKKIGTISLHRGRLALTADESIVMSSANEFFNTHRTTMITIVDGDPIDTDVSFRKVSLIRHAIPFNENLILFSDTDQFALTGSPTLTPVTARIVPITSYDSVIDTSPVPAASSLFFGFNHGTFAGVRELFPTDSTTFEAIDITEAAPAYIPGKIRQFASSTDENIVAALSSTETSSIYIYRYYEVGSGSQKKKVQSAWSRFTFGSDANIRHISFMDEDLFLIVQRTDGLHMEKMRIEPKLVDTGLNFRAMLDRRITYAGTNGTITASFSAATGNTTFTFPYAKRGRTLDGLINNGVRVNIVTQPSDGGNTLVVSGDLTSNTVFLGESYEMDYEFSKAYLRTSSQTGGQQPIISGRYQLRFGNLIHEDTGFFTIEVASPNRDTAVTTFTGLVVGQDETDGLNLSDGTFRFPILLKNLDASISIKNDSPFPSRFMAAEFEASFNTKVRQRL